MFLGLTVADIVKTAMTASIQGLAIFFSVRYVGKLVERAEKAMIAKDKVGKSDGK